MEHKTPFTCNQEELVREDWEKEFDKKFECIQLDCDGYGNIPVLVSGSRQISDTEFEQIQELTAEQCQFHEEYIFPIKTFIRKLLAEEASKCVEHEAKVKQDIADWALEHSFITANGAMAVKRGDLLEQLK